MMSDDHGGQSPFIIFVTQMPVIYPPVPLVFTSTPTHSYPTESTTPLPLVAGEKRKNCMMSMIRGDHFCSNIIVWMAVQAGTLSLCQGQLIVVSTHTLTHKMIATLHCVGYWRYTSQWPGRDNLNPAPGGHDNLGTSLYSVVWYPHVEP